MAVLEWETIAGLVYEQGLRGEAAAIAVAITAPESERDFAAHNDNPGTGDDSWGGWMINMLGDLGPDRRARYGLSRNEDLLDPPTNARVMYGESGGGSNWRPWTTFKNGRHTPYLEEARRAVATVEARGGNPSTFTETGVTTSTTSDRSAAGAARALGRSADVVSALPQAIDPTVGVARSVHWDSGFFIRGQSALLTVVADQLVGGALDMTVSDIAELSLEVSGGHINTLWPIAQDLALGTAVDWWDLQFSIVGVEWGEGDGQAVGFTARCRAAGPEAMRKRAGNIQREWVDLSPSEVMADRAADNGLRFVGEGSNRRDLIVRKGPENGANQMPTSDTTDTESDWDLGQRLAREEGYWCFEAAGTLYFARPSWLVSRMPHFPVDPRGDLRGSDDVDQVNTGTVGLPSASQAVDDDLLPGMPPRTVTVRIPRDRGEQIRPGMVADFDGLPLFVGSYLVSKVSYPLDGGIEPAQVDLVDARDPVPQPPADDSTTDPADPAAGAGSSSATPVGTGGASALDMTTVALRQIGKNYVYGAEAALDDPDPTAFDCSELIQWACAQVGVTFADGSENQMAAIDAAGLSISVEEASHIRGAFLWHEGHCAISLGDGEHTVEAMGRQYGVVQGNIANRFTRAGLIPGLDYSVDNTVAAGNRRFS